MNFRESYIESIRLKENNKVIIRVYDYYWSEFREINIFDLEDAKDALRFALEFGEFEYEKKSDSAGNLSDRQLDALEEFVLVAKRLNDIGVSLIWDEEENSLRAVNRDKMKDNNFFQADESGDIPSDANCLNDEATAGINIEITPTCKEYPLYYFPNTE